MVPSAWNWSGPEESVYFPLANTVMTQIILNLAVEGIIYIEGVCNIHLYLNVHKGYIRKKDRKHKG